MWESLTRHWREVESVWIPVASTVVVVAVGVIAQLRKLLGSRKAEEALSVAEEARAMASENRRRIHNTEHRVSECYGIVLSLQNDMAAMSRHVDEMAVSAETFADSARLLGQHAEQIKALLRDSGLPTTD